MRAFAGVFRLHRTWTATQNGPLPGETRRFLSHGPMDAGADHDGIRDAERYPARPRLRSKDAIAVRLRA
ncbi:MAG: hypothetical protein LC620_08700, partial [Halobacteriales archaeon]|nr:hypothetical protein [Halobacteriales archaeon]